MSRATRIAIAVWILLVLPLQGVLASWPAAGHGHAGHACAGGASGGHRHAVASDARAADHAGGAHPAGAAGRAIAVDLGPADPAATGHATAADRVLADRAAADDLPRCPMAGAACIASVLPAEPFVFAASAPRGGPVPLTLHPPVDPPIAVPRPPPRARLPA